MNFLKFHTTGDEQKKLNEFDQQRSFGIKTFCPDMEKAVALIDQHVLCIKYLRTAALGHTFSLKTSIHKEIDELVNCLRKREEELYAAVDELHIQEDVKMQEKLFNLLALQAQYSILYECKAFFKDNVDIQAVLGNKCFHDLCEQDIPTKMLLFNAELHKLKTSIATFGSIEYVNVQEKNMTYGNKKSCKDSSDVSPEHGSLSETDKFRYIYSTKSEISIPMNVNMKCYEEKLSDSSDSFEVVAVETLPMKEFEKNAIKDGKEENFSNRFIKQEPNDHKLFLNNLETSSKVSDWLDKNSRTDTYDSSTIPLASEDLEEKNEPIVKLRNQMKRMWSNEKSERCNKIDRERQCTQPLRTVNENSLHKKILPTKSANQEFPCYTDVTTVSCTYNKTCRSEDIKNFDISSCNLCHTDPSVCIKEAFSSQFARTDVNEWLLPSVHE